MKSNFFLLVFILSAFSSFSQSATKPKSTSDLMGSKPCKLTKQTMKPIAYESILEEGGEIPNTERPSRFRSGTIVEDLKHFASLAEGTPPFFKIDTLQNGNNTFREAGLIGLKDHTGKIVVPRTFSFVKMNEKNGFIGYVGATCNYYGLTEKKLFQNNNYYSIQPTNAGTFIVQTETGYGVLKANGSVLIKPTQFLIRSFTADGNLFYKIYTDTESSYFVSSTAKDTIWFNAGHDIPTALDKDHWMIAGDIINIKNKTWIDCKGTSYIEIVHPKKKLASITITKTRQVYLIGYDGKLITPTSFNAIRQFGERDVSIAAIDGSDTNEFSAGNPKFGVIDVKGNWLVSPTYRQLQIVNDGFLLAMDQSNKYGLLTMSDEIVLPFEYEDVRKVSDSLVLLVRLENDNYNSALFNTATQKFIAKDLPYGSIHSADLCNGKLFIAEVRGGECWTNENFERVSPIFERVFYGPDKNTIEGANYPKTSPKKESRIYNCSGDLMTFNINGKMVDIVDEYEKFSDSLYHVMLPNREGYFIFPDGSSLRSDLYIQYLRPANIEDFTNVMVYGGRFGMIDSKGNTIVPITWEYLSPFDPMTGLAKYNYDDQQKGYLKNDGTLLFGTDYEETEELGFNLFKVKRNNEWKVVDINNKDIIPFQTGRISMDGGLITLNSSGEISKYTILGQKLR